MLLVFCVVWHGFGCLSSYNGSLYAVGGLGTGGTRLSSTEVFDGTSWSAGPDLTTARWTFGLASF